MFKYMYLASNHVHVSDCISQIKNIKYDNKFDPSASFVMHMVYSQDFDFSLLIK